MSFDTNYQNTHAYSSLENQTAVFPQAQNTSTQPLTVIPSSNFDTSSNTKYPFQGTVFDPFQRAPELAGRFDPKKLSAFTSLPESMSIGLKYTWETQNNTNFWNKDKDYKQGDQVLIPSGFNDKGQPTKSGVYVKTSLSGNSPPGQDNVWWYAGSEWNNTKHDLPRQTQFIQDYASRTNQMNRFNNIT